MAQWLKGKLIKKCKVYKVERHKKIIQVKIGSELGLPKTR